MLLSNRLFFEQVEAMLAEGHEVQIRMKGHSMRPLLRNERDIAVLTPIANYAGDSTPERPSPTTDALQENIVPAEANLTNQTLRSNADSEPNVQSGHDIPHGPDNNAPHKEIRHSCYGIDALRAGDIVLFRCDGRHILHRIIRRDAERFTLAGDGNYRMQEHCTAGDIVAVMTAVIRPSGRIVRTASRRWRRQSRCWQALPAGVRRFMLRVLWQLGVR